MIKHLQIKNYALISNLDIEFENGFSVITGETGAGKSIILGALALVMGARADIKSITDGEQKCIIEAEFETTSGTHLTSVILRRELYANGKSRAFIDDSPVSLTELKDAATALVDIHSQHENLLIGDSTFQIEVVDAVAGNEDIKSNYQSCFTDWQNKVSALRQLQDLAEKSKLDADYINFQYNQLAEAELVSGELEELEDEQDRLSHAEERKTEFYTALELLDGNEQSAVSLLHEALRYVPAELNSRLQSAYLEIKDIAEETSSLADRTNVDPERLQIVEERLDLLNTLLHKHHKQTIDELIALRDELEKQIVSIDSYDEQIQVLKLASEKTYKAMQEAAKVLTTSRRNVVTTIVNDLEQNLTKLGIVHAKMNIQISELSEYTISGKDDIQFMFAANLNQSLRQVSEIASGGEMSRLMLCIKNLIANTQKLPTIIFDEVDAGVSGEVANKIGDIMNQMAAHRQVICITHLPQVAVKGSYHYKVYKEDSATRTETKISRLSNAERINEIASLLSGQGITPAAIENAKQLLNIKN